MKESPKKSLKQVIFNKETNEEINPCNIKRKVYNKNIRRREREDLKRFIKGDLDEEDLEE